MDAAAAFLDWLGVGAGSSEARVLIVAAHPDDETIGLGGQLPRLPNAILLHVTDGAPRDGRDVALHGFPDAAAYAAARRAELLAALAMVGIGAERALCLDVPDQQASLRLPELARRIAAAARAMRPAVVVTHAYEGGHPDHDATAFAVHAALRLVDPATRPALIEMAGYHAGPERMATGRFLPTPGAADALSLRLPPEGCALKRRMLDAFATQRTVLAPFPIGEERFRAAPAYDFTRPPHPGRLHFENFPWGMDGAWFRDLAAQALGELGLR